MKISQGEKSAIPQEAKTLHHRGVLRGVNFSIHYLHLDSRMLLRTISWFNEAQSGVVLFKENFCLVSVRKGNWE